MVIISGCSIILSNPIVKLLGVHNNSVDYRLLVFFFFNRRKFGKIIYERSILQMIFNVIICVRLMQYFSSCLIFDVRVLLPESGTTLSSHRIRYYLF